MNYYPFHIGDYVSATRHLSWDEDAAYRRLLDTYYTTEKALPADVAKVCRLVMATTDSQRAAVQTVLEEFFVLTAEGWVNGRADEEISSMRKKVKASEEKGGNEKTRKERYRERRAFLFAFLRERSAFPAYDISMKELQDLARSKGWDGTLESVPSVPVPSEKSVPATVPVERSGNVPGDASGTAIPTPTPTPTLPGVTGGDPPNPELSSKTAPKVEVPPWVPAAPWKDFVEMRRAKGRRAPFTVAAAKGIIADLDRLREQGQDLTAVLQQSVNNGWSGVFVVKLEPQARGKAPGADWTGSAT